MMRRVVVHDEDIQEGEIVESSWDLRKIAIGIVLLIILIGAGIFGFRILKSNFTPASRSGVLGTSSQSQPKEIPPLPNKEDIENAISDAKDTLSSITSENLTSSQAAIQKIISDLETLQGKNGAVGLICKLMCKDK